MIRHDNASLITSKFGEILLFVNPDPKPNIQYGFQDDPARQEPRAPHKRRSISPSFVFNFARSRIRP